MLQFNLSNGKSYVYETAWNMDQTIMNQPSTVNISGVYGIEVLSEEAGIRTLKGVYRNFKMYMKMMGMEIDVDTDKPNTPVAGDENNPSTMVARVFSGIAGKTFTMKVDQEGKVIEVSGIEEMVKSMVDSMDFDANTKQQMQASLEDQFNEQSIKDAFAQAFYIFPNKKVKDGDSWTKTFTMGGKTPSKQTTTYTVTDIEGDIVTLDTKTDISSVGEMEISGSQTGKVLVDSRTGLMVNGNFDQNMKVKVQGMDMDIKAKGTVKGRPE